MNNMQMKIPMEKCLVLLKPDCVSRNLSGLLIEKMESAGLKIIALKMVFPSEELIGKHYTDDYDWLVKAGRKRWQRSHPDQELPEKEAFTIGKEIRKYLIEALSHQRIIAMVVVGLNTIEHLRKMAGSTEPLSADPGTFRSDYSTDSYDLANSEHRSIRNLIHVSDSVETANREIKIWFNQDEIYE